MLLLKNCSNTSIVFRKNVNLLKNLNYIMLKHRHAMHARIIFWGWVDCLKHCKWYLHSYKRKVEYVACRLQSGYKMQTENLKSFLFGMVISCHLATYQASCNRFSAISFHDYLHYCGIFLAHFLMKIDRNIISSLYRVFSLCMRVGCCGVSTDFTNIIKVDVDVNEMSLLNI